LWFALPDVNELALSLAARYPDIDGVVAIVPGMAVFPGITDAMTTSFFTWQGEPLPFVPVPWSTTWPLITGDLLRVSEIMLEDTAAVANAVIPVGNINGPFLFVSASQDELWPSRAMSDAMMMQRLELHQFPHAHEHIIIDGGHTSPARHFKGIEAFLDRIRKADPESACHRARSIRHNRAMAGHGARGRGCNARGLGRRLAPGTSAFETETRKRLQRQSPPQVNRPE